MRATVPVNLRPLEHAKQLGNHFGLVFLELPVGEANPMRRLERIAASMKVLRKSRQAVATFGALAAVGMAPPAVQAFALEMFSRKASAVATNVPGPQMPLYFGGSKIKDLMFWVPQTGSIGLGISILSYQGKVHFGLIADAKAAIRLERGCTRQPDACQDPLFDHDGQALRRAGRMEGVARLRVPRLEPPPEPRHPLLR